MNRVYDLLKLKKQQPINDENNKAFNSKLNIIVKEIWSLKGQLKRTDYQAIKFAEGEMSEEEYAPIRTKRAEWRARINLLESQKGDKL